MAKKKNNQWFTSFYDKNDFTEAELAAAFVNAYRREYIQYKDFIEKAGFDSGAIGFPELTPKDIGTTVTAETIEALAPVLNQLKSMNKLAAENPEEVTGILRGENDFLGSHYTKQPDEVPEGIDPKEGWIDMEEFFNKYKV